MSHWSEPYVGIPFSARGASLAGCDCWGLARMVYADILHIGLESFDGAYVSTDEREEISSLVAGEKETGDWIETDASLAGDFDILVFEAMGFQSHVGIVAAPGMMLHATEGRLSEIVSYKSGSWRHRLRSVYRHRNRA